MIWGIYYTMEKMEMGVDNKYLQDTVGSSWNDNHATTFQRGYDYHINRFPNVSPFPPPLA